MHVEIKVLPTDFLLPKNADAFQFREIYCCSLSLGNSCFDEMFDLCIGPIKEKLNQLLGVNLFGQMLLAPYQSLREEITDLDDPLPAKDRSSFNRIQNIENPRLPFVSFRDPSDEAVVVSSNKIYTLLSEI